MKTTAVCRLVPFLSLSFLLLLGCNSPSTYNKIASADATEFLPDTIFIPYNQAVQIGETAMSLCFDTIFSDSRCPEDVNCIWAGAFEIGIELSDQNEIHKLKLSTYPKGITDTILSGYSIKVVDLLPRPNTTIHYVKSDYRVRVVVDKTN